MSISSRDLELRPLNITKRCSGLLPLVHQKKTNAQGMLRGSSLATKANSVVHSDTNTIGMKQTRLCFMPRSCVSTPV